MFNIKNKEIDTEKIIDLAGIVVATVVVTLLSNRTQERFIKLTAEEYHKNKSS